MSTEYSIVFLCGIGFVVGVYTFLNFCEDCRCKKMKEGNYKVADAVEVAYAEPIIIEEPIRIVII